ncbi:hypothetical protein MPTK1_6g17300 [Marchantia polymorpha subsp. ruderalis]|uniref:PPIase cyclophilin-type domain-containing protein n=2 Tax=Marchantia polymorpha TaxID=3197 RepID=A0AAF6BSZ6_MARPO|nr:hypothetical protein MARPO_0184s0020 [Marchantia polymorpha]BBN15130.1 hypothetical protein Mp_6g17300 [Marchantia polymorpha subsp. ruderalis]|eukprot:PTQ27782.1 hypothetical protein MARPO_0184s0020 [Marchantia polymorpha]
MAAFATIPPRALCCSSSSTFARDGSFSFLTRQPGRTSLVKNGELLRIRSVAEEQESSQKLSRAIVSRRTVLHTGLSLCGSTTLLGNLDAALAEDELPITKKVFFDVSIDGQPVGRIVVGVYGTAVPIGAQRFGEIAVGQRGISYRRKEFQKITPTYIQNVGVRTFSLSGGSADAANFTGGETNEALVAEMAELDKKGTRLKNLKGSVSLIVVDPTKPPPKPRLVARDGKFSMVEEEARPDPNGTEFMIVTADAPELDASNLVVGRVVEGLDVVNQIANVKVVQENTSSPYFQAAKLIGDTRVIVAEKGFYRPYSKVLIMKSGEVTQ